MTGLTAGGFLSLTGPLAPRVAVSPLRAMSIIMPPFGGHVHIEYHNHSYHHPPRRHFVALVPSRGRKNVTGLAFCVICHEKHSADWLAALASPYPAAPDFPLFSGQNKALQSNPFTQRIAKNKVPPPGGRWWRQPPKGVHFQRPQGGCMVFPRAKARL